MIKVTKDIVLQVKELMSRNLDSIDIAHRMGVDIDDIRIIIELINNLLT